MISLINHYYLTFDVGGLFIRGGVLKKDGNLLTESLTYYPAKSNAGTEEILNHFVEIICQQINAIVDKYYVIDGIGFAFPGPFDYENGISFISGVEKFDSLYGINLRTELGSRLNRKKVVYNRISTQFKLLFENNVSMFALGEWYKQQSRGINRSMYITIGNGTGSAFLEGGSIIKNRSDVPPNGWIYNIPFRDSVVDDYISTRGILRIAQEMKIDPRLSLGQLANQAMLEDEDIRQVFNRFGNLLGELLLKFIKPFQPDSLIIGGQISKSFDLYREPVEYYLRNESVSINLSDATSNSTFIGLSSLFHNEIHVEQ